MNRNNPLALLKRLARPDPAGECCDFCSVRLEAAHRHLLELATRKMVCVCNACALRFQAAVGRYKLIPRDARRLPDLRLADEQWESLALPINLVFIFRHSAQSRMVALYPSPAGATESLLPLSSWEALVQANPALGQMEADVEALLVNRLGSARNYYLAPIDACFELTGLMRLHWRGLAGGEKVWQEINRFFSELESRSAPARNAREAVACA